MYKYLCLIILLFLIYGCRKVNEEHKISAEKFFRGVYGCNPSVVDNLAADNIYITYPIFEELFNTPKIKGRKAVKDFVTGFCNRWKDAQINIHESIAEANEVVLIWSFKARRVISSSNGTDSTGHMQSWGGITLYRFNDEGKISAEIGEESAPGPFERSFR